MPVVQASPSAHAFYDGAILTLRIQVAVMSAITIFWTAAIVALEPQLGGFGARTPILPLSVMVSILDIRGLANNVNLHSTN